ncbi:MAG: sigma 54-interacting transcriptional regulator [Firmicutes bacterium]|nr:sigma 54-interacting transcriptional regulator [Bacillota bacterium]
MIDKYGTSRVLEPKFVLPTVAWKLDNGRKICPDEMRIDVKRIHLERTSFKEICLESNDNDQRIIQKIMDIVIRRGKLHNPVTDTGGLLSGIVSEIGDEYPNKKNFAVGDAVICNASLTSIPLYIDKIISIDRAYGQIDIDGYAIISSSIPMIRKPQDLPLPFLLFTLDESGTIYRVSSTAVGKKRFLVVGNNLLSNILFGMAIRKVAGTDAEIVCFLDRKTDTVLRGPSIDRLVAKVFTRVHSVDILKPMECLNQIGCDSYYDLSVNCADITGAETINILATKSGGTVVFANLINNYNIALYITEATSKQLDIRSADGYLEAYDQFDFEIVRELLPYVEEAEEQMLSLRDDPTHPITSKSMLSKDPGERHTLMEDLVCESRAMAAVMDEVLTVSKYDCNVFITGETGVGKEKIANIIHKNSTRKLQPFIKVNCASLPADLAELEFFGYEETGDGSDRKPSNIHKKGLLERADNGSLYLDDVTGLRPDMQAKLLRAIQDGEFYRVGGHEPIKTNVRIISTTNKDLEDVIEHDGFRRDLYYALNVVRLRVPALRERIADIPKLVQHFLSDYGNRFDLQRTISDDAVEYLCQCDWAGNTRELENVVQRLMISSKSDEIALIDVMREMHSDVFDLSGASTSISLDDEYEVNLDVMVENFEKNIIRHALEKYGSTRKAAKAIGISQTQLVRKKNKYGL